MEKRKFKDFQDLFEYTSLLFQTKEDISIIADYEDAVFLMNVVSDVCFKEKHIELYSEEDNYVISKITDEFFCIEPLYRDGKLFHTEAETLIVMEYVLEEDVRILDYCHSDNLFLFTIDGGEYSQEDDITNDLDCCCGCKCDCECQDIWEVITDKLNDTLEVIEEDCCDECLKDALMELLMFGVGLGVDGYFGRVESDIKG